MIFFVGVLRVKQSLALLLENLTVVWEHENNKDTDQPAHWHSLVRALLFVFLKVIKLHFLHVKFQYSSYVVYVAE